MKIATWLSTAAATISAALLAACDVAVQEIQPGLTTAAEVKARMGEPGFLHANSDGTVTWEYSRQPSGIHCYMITMGNNLIVEKLEQVLTEANLQRARAMAQAWDESAAVCMLNTASADKVTS